MATNPNQPGIGIDSRGGAVVDPTKNVEDLVKALEAKLVDLRVADQKYVDYRFSAMEYTRSVIVDAMDKFQTFARESEVRASNGMNMAETRRIDQLASTRQEFQNTIRDMLAESVRTTSSLVSTQLVQIQATFDTRVTKLEASQLTQAGRSSVVDPATEASLSRITGTMTALAGQLAAMQAEESRAGGRGAGRMDTNARLLSVVMAVAAVASPVIAILVTIMAVRGGHP